MINDHITKEAYEHQQDTWDSARERELFAHDTGTGKTLTAIGLAFDRVDSAIVVCPLSVYGKWITEFDIWSEEYEIVEREDRYTKLIADDTKIFIVTKEYFMMNRKEMPVMEAFICDESHHIAGKTSKTSKAAVKYCMQNDIPHRYLLTATPYMSTPWNIYRLAKVLGYDWNYKKFERTYCEPRYFGKTVRMVPRDNLHEEMAELVAKIGDIVHISECADVPDQIDQVETVPLKSKQKSALNDATLNNLKPIVRYTKHHQIENGYRKGDEGYEEDVYFSNHKIARIKDYVQEKDKVAVVCRYNNQLHQIADKLSGKNKKPVYKIWGGDKNRDETIEAVQNADECVVLINAAVSEGYELPEVNLCVFASMSFSYVHYRQMRGRFLRLNKMTKNVYVHLLAERDGGEQSIDEAVYESVVKKKQRFDIEIYSRGRGDMQSVSGN